jgi:hypothetical protein
MRIAGRKARVTDKKSIIRLLYSCKTLRRPVGIYSNVIGSKMRICYIMGVVITDDIIIILQPYDLSGKIIGRNILSLSQVESVVPVG